MDNRDVIAMKDCICLIQFELSTKIKKGNMFLENYHLDNINKKLCLQKKHCIVLELNDVENGIK